MDRLLIDDWVYMKVDGQVGMYGKDELQRLLKNKVRSVQACFLECESKLITLRPEMSLKKEQAVQNAFTGDYLTQVQWLRADQALVIAAKKEYIDEVHQRVAPIHIGLLVPYPVCIRAFLISMNVLPQNKAVIFLDDLKSQAVVTIFEGTYFTSPRRISLRDTDYLLTEVRRSWMSYCSARASQGERQDIECFLISNNAQWLNDVVEKEFLVQDQTLFMEESMCALEGLKNAKFSMHFAPAKDVAQQKHNHQIKTRLMQAGSWAGMVMLGLSVYLFILFIEQGVLRESTKAQQLNQRLQQDLTVMHVRKLGAVLPISQMPQGLIYYYDFMKQLPQGYVLEEYEMEVSEAGQLKFSADTIVHNRRIFDARFRLNGLWQSSETSTIYEKKKFGKRIEMIKYAKGNV